MFNSVSFSLVGDKPFVCMNLRVMAAVELHLNATYAPHSALKSVHEKSQSVLGQGLQDSKTSNLNCLYEVPTCPERSIDHMS